MHQGHDVKRRHDGSIDLAHYTQVARTLRSLAARGMVRDLSSLVGGQASAAGVIPTFLASCFNASPLARLVGVKHRAGSGRAGSTRS